MSTHESAVSFPFFFCGNVVEDNLKVMLTIVMTLMFAHLMKGYDAELPRMA